MKSSEYVKENGKNFKDRMDLRTELILDSDWTDFRKVVELIRSAISYTKCVWTLYEASKCDPQKIQLP